MGRSEYNIIRIRLVPPKIIAHYKLNELVDQYGWIYTEIIRGMYGLPQAGIIAKNLLAHNLHNHGYYQVKRTTLLWRHVWRPIYLTFIVENFGIRYVGR